MHLPLKGVYRSSIIYARYELIRGLPNYIIDGYHNWIEEQSYRRNNNNRIVRLDDQSFNPLTSGFHFHPFPIKKRFEAWISPSFLSQEI